MLISNFQIISGKNSFTVLRTARCTKVNRLAQIYIKFTRVPEENKYFDKKLIRLALSYSYHLPKLLVSEKCYLFNESEQLGILYCVMFSTIYL